MPVTREYADGFDRTFGKKKRARGHYRYDAKAKKLVEIGADWVNPDSKRGFVFGEAHYDGLRTADGREDISSKAKHRAYMKRHGLVLSHEKTEHRKKTDKERREFFTQGGGQAEMRAREELIGRKLYEIEQRKRRNPRER